MSREVRRAVEHLNLLLGLPGQQEEGATIATTDTTTSSSFATPQDASLPLDQLSWDAYEGNEMTKHLKDLPTVPFATISPIHPDDVRQILIFSEYISSVHATAAFGEDIMGLDEPRSSSAMGVSMADLLLTNNGFCQSLLSPCLSLIWFL